RNVRDHPFAQKQYRQSLALPHVVFIIRRGARDTANPLTADASANAGSVGESQQSDLHLYPHECRLPPTVCGCGCLWPRHYVTSRCDSSNTIASGRASSRLFPPHRRWCFFWRRTRAVVRSLSDIDQPFQKWRIPEKCGMPAVVLLVLEFVSFGQKY